MINPAKNEVEIKLGDKTYKAKASFDFICQVENAFNLSITHIVMDKLNAGDVRAAELLAILSAGIAAAGGNVSTEELQEAILNAGTVATIGAVIPLLLIVFNGPSVKKK